MPVNEYLIKRILKLVAKHTRDLDTVTVDIEGVNTAIDTINDNIDTINTELDSIDTSISTITDDITSINDSITSINGLIATANTAISDLETDVGTLQTDLDAAETAIGILETDVGNLQTNVSALTTALTPLNTRALLAAATIPSGTNTVRTLGYAAAGDGGGANFKKAASEPTHEGKVQSADGAWWEISDKVLTPQMFGVFGGGSLDETTGLQNAINASASLRAVLDLGKESLIYRITSTITLPAYSNIQGKATIKMDIPGSGSSKIALQAHGTEVTDASNAGDLASDYTAQELTCTVTDASFFTEGDDVFLQDTGRYSYALFPDISGSPDPNAVNKGILLQVRSVDTDTEVVTFCTPAHDDYTTANSAVLKKINWLDKIRLSGFRIEGTNDNTNSGIEYAVSLKYCRDLVIDNIYTENCMDTGIRLVHCLRPIVKNCYIRSVDYDDADADDDLDGSNFLGIVLGGATRDAIIKSNFGRRVRHLVVTGTSGGDYGEAYKCLVDGNIVVDAQMHTNVDGSTGSNASSYAIEVHTLGTGITITNNVIDGCYSGVHVKGGRDILIANNKISNYLGAGVSFGSWSEISGGTVSDVLVTGNTIKGYTGIPYENGGIPIAAFLFYKAATAGVETGVQGTFSRVKITNNHCSDLWNSANPTAGNRGSILWAEGLLNTVNTTDNVLAYSGCEFSDNYCFAGTGNIGATTPWAINISDGAGSDWVIRNNRIMGWHSCIYTGAAKRVQIIGNLFEVTGGAAPTSSAAIYCAGSGTDTFNNITGNTFRGTFEAVEIDGDRNLVVNNIFRAIGAGSGNEIDNNGSNNTVTPNYSVATEVYV